MGARPVRVPDGDAGGSGSAELSGAGAAPQRGRSVLATAVLSDGKTLATSSADGLRLACTRSESLARAPRGCSTAIAVNADPFTATALGTLAYSTSLALTPGAPA